MESRTSVHIHSGAIFNVQFRETTIHSPATRDAIISSRQAVLAFFASILINLLQIKYQGKDESPFETNPNTILVAVLSLSIYCLSYDAKLRNLHNFTVLKSLIHISMVIFGPLSLASILSLLFPGFFQPILCVGAILYSLSHVPRSEIKKAWKWLEVFILRRRTDYRPSGGTMVSIIQGSRVQDPAMMIDQVDIIVIPGASVDYL